MNGDGRWTFVDVNTFFQRAEGPAIRNHTAAHDFDGRGAITVQDVLSLLDQEDDGDGDGLTTSEKRPLGSDRRLADTDGEARATIANITVRTAPAAD